MTFSKSILLLLPAVFCIRLDRAHAAAPRLCETLFQTQPDDKQVLKDAIQIRQITFGSQKTGDELALEYFDDLVHRSEPFADYVARASTRQPIATRAASIGLLERYIRDFWGRLRNPKSLLDAQDDAIDRELDVHGAKKFQISRGWNRLEQVSRENRNRIFRTFDLAPIEKAPSVIVDLVKKHTLGVRRNSRVPITFGEGILSSRQIQILTGAVGYNSLHSFNRNFMKSDDSIFFFVDFDRQKQPQVAVSEFGKHTQWLAKEDFPERAWVSAYVMYNHELADAAVASSEIRSNLQTRIFEPGTDSLKSYSPSESEVEIVRNLHRVDFTAADYLIVMQAALARILTPTENEIANELKRAGARPSSKTRALAISKLAETKLEDIYSATSPRDPFSAYVMKSIGLPEKMELKVPVFLPQRHLSTPGPSLE
jgi:hypothetical protein